MQSVPSVIIREMQSGEEKTLLHMARRAFIHSPLEQLVISKPKSALVAEVDGAIAGAMFLRIFGAGEKKAGYLDIGFVNKEYRGLGIARVLYPFATEFLREKGCDLVTAQVIDDNAASWKPLRNQGFGEPSLTGFVNLLGFGRAIRLWLQTHAFIACGSRLWIDSPVKKRGSVQELVSFLCMNLFLFLPWLIKLINQPNQFLAALLAYPSVLLVGVLFGGIGCLMTGGSWHFSFPRSGTLLTLLINIFGGLFPMVGRWYLEDPQATKQCRHSMGVQAAIEWAGMMVLFTLGTYLFKENAFLNYCTALTAQLLLYRMLPFLPFGGGRVWSWNKIVFSSFAIATITLIFIVS